MINNDNCEDITPMLSIITVTYNAADVLQPTLDSVAKQSYRDFEHLIVDGKSQDATIAKAKESGIAEMRIISEPDKGLYDAMNKALHLARGRYVVYLNAGDRFADADAVSRIAKGIEANADIIYGQTLIVDKQGIVIGERHLRAPLNLTADSFKRGMLVCHQAFVVRKAIAPDYDLTYRFSADYDWCIKCLKHSRANHYVGDRALIHFLTAGITNRYHKQSLNERYRIMCKNYGTLSTVLRHISFIPRYLLQKIKR